MSYPPSRRDSLGRQEAAPPPSTAATSMRRAAPLRAPASARAPEVKAPEPGEKATEEALTPPPRPAQARGISTETLHEIVLSPKEKEEDPFTAAVLRRLGNDILLSLTPEQQKRLKQALYDSRPLQGHALDVRGVVPFFFWRFYYVLLMGRDRRRSTRRVEGDRRRRARLIEDAIYVLVLLWHVVFVLAVVLYLIKSALGINLMPHRHAWELLMD